MEEVFFEISETKTLLKSLLPMGNDEYRFLSDREDNSATISIFRFGEFKKKTLKITLFRATNVDQIFNAWTIFVKKIDKKKQFESIEKTETTLWFYVNDYNGERLPFSEIEEFLEAGNFNKIDYSKARLAYRIATLRYQMGLRVAESLNLFRHKD
ncbi:hypothetical protein N9W89_01970 [Hellea sp.]|nr:hypothetical protein [Hellea sp.]